MSTDTDAPDSLAVELPVVPATFSTAGFLADALGIDDEDVPAKPEGAALLIILEALYWPWRNPDSRAVYVGDRRTWDRPTGGVLQELEKEEVQQGVLSLYALLHDGQPASLSVYRMRCRPSPGRRNCSPALPDPESVRVQTVRSGSTWDAPMSRRCGSRPAVGRWNHTSGLSSVAPVRPARYRFPPAAAPSMPYGRSSPSPRPTGRSSGHG